MNGLILQHFAEQAVSLDRTREYRQTATTAHGKPRGFWVSVQGEDDWPTWCREENFGTHRLSTTHNVTLRADSNVLFLTSPELLDAFTKTYGISEHKTLGRHSWTDTRIDWPRVATEYDGVIIAPYQWERRMGLDWYYGWDVASGCIWNLTAIESVEATSFLMVEALQ